MHIYKNISEHKPTKPGTSNNRHANIYPVKITVVGDGACGKTCIMQSWANDGKIDDRYEPTIFETYAADFKMHKLVDTLRESAAKKHGGKEF